jgi:hypothetical protein
VKTSVKHKLVLPIWVRVSSLGLILMVAANMSLGSPLHSSQRGCKVADQEMSDCEANGMSPSGDSVIGIDPCCLLDCQETGPTGSIFSGRTPTLSISTIHPAALTPPVTQRLVLQQDWLQSSSFPPPNTCLKNLALLI